jgi:hypothetical protein
VKESLTARERRLYRLCAFESSGSSGSVLGVIVEETRGSDVGLASSCNGIELTMGAFGLLKRLYEGLDKGVSTVVALLVALLVADEPEVSHELGAGLSTLETCLGVVGAGD